MSNNVYARLTQLLDQQTVAYEALTHAAVYTSEAAAAVRGTTLSSGAKALVCKADGDFLMYVLPADRKLASKQIRKANGIKSLRFASRDEVLEITGLTPGSIPPFGSLFELPTYCDVRLESEPTINFNAGDHERSIKIAFVDYVQVEEPIMGNFAE